MTWEGAAASARREAPPAFGHPLRRSPVHHPDRLPLAPRHADLLPISRDAATGPYIQLQLARIYLLVGEPEKALDQLEPLLKMPYYLSPGWLRIDPTFDPVRNNPRFKRLVQGRA